ncbi:MAG: hypothetical protein ACR2PB_02785 [Desulfocapsaceae bacterium]
MSNGINLGLIVFVIIACGWYISFMYYALKSWKSVVCYTLVPVIGICATGLTFATIGIQHIYPPLFLVVPLLGSAIGVYIGYRIDQKTG